MLALRQADDLAREVAEASQALATAHLGRAPRIAYWQHVLDAYVALYRDDRDDILAEEDGPAGGPAAGHQQGQAPNKAGDGLP